MGILGMRRLLAQAILPYARLRTWAQPGLRILMYHRVATLPHYDQLTVSPARFARQMERLACEYRVVSLADGLRAIGQGQLRRPLVAVTFDDGYRDNLTEALPILRRHAVPATIFVTTRFCEQAESHPRYGPSPERLHLDWDEVAVLAATPGITIGSHTLHHPYLPTLPEAQAREEIAQSRTIIESRIGQPVAFFCYPSGDLGPRELRLVHESGYAAAVSVAPGVNYGWTDPLKLRRTEITDRDDDEAFTLKMAGAFDPIHRLLHAKRMWNFARGFGRPSAQTSTRP